VVKWSLGKFSSKVCLSPAGQLPVLTTEHVPAYHCDLWFCCSSCLVVGVHIYLLNHSCWWSARHYTCCMIIGIKIVISARTMHPGHEVQMSRHYPFSFLLQSENTCAILCWLMVWIPKIANIIELSVKSGKYGMGSICLPDSQ
jgi:hypothetical protein